MLMERAGTGGALFRNLYRDFLKESYELLKLDVLKQVMKSLQKLQNTGLLYLNYLKSKPGKRHHIYS